MIKFTRRVTGIVGMALTLVACAGVLPPNASDSFMPSKNKLSDLGPAPDFNSAPWLNTTQPLTLSALRGKVVLVEFWTFG